MTTILEWLKTDHLREVIEAVQSHAVRNQVEAANARSDLFKRQRVLMDDWARFLDQGPAEDRGTVCGNARGHQV